MDLNKKPECHYYIADYQGPRSNKEGLIILREKTNIYVRENRMVVNARTNEVEQTTHYYPYGGIIGNLSSNQEAQKYKYSNKELDRTYGLDLYDFQARLFNPALPVFDRPDPLAEKYCSISPYAYCAGDPVNCVDPDGRDVFTVSTMGTIQKTNISTGTTIIFYSQSSNEVTNVVKFAAERGMDNALNGIQTIQITLAPGLKPENLCFGQMSSEQAFDLQNVMTQNTDVEWSAIATQDGSGMLSTSQNTKKVEVGQAMNRCGIESKDVKTNLHGHPGRNAEDGSTSEGTRGGSDGDRKQVKQGTRYYVNHQGTNLIYEYNSTQQCVGEPQTFEEWKKNQLK